MKKIITLICFVFAFTLIISCSGYGKKIVFNGTEVYYTSQVEKKDAEKLGAFLVRSEFANGKGKSVQLTKNEENNHFVFRMVVNDEAAKSDMYEILFKAMAIQLSDSVFNASPVDFHVCDDRFNTLKELAFK